MSILISSPGIGDKLTVRLLEKFKTPIKAINVSTAGLSRIDGMSYARALKLRNILDTVIIDEKIDLQTALVGYDIDKNIV